MTNQRKSFIVSVFVILALALGIMLISQGLMARIDPKPERAMLDDIGTQLNAPLPGDVDLAKPAIKPLRTQELIPVTVGDEAVSRAADKAASSTENGGETYATATVIAAVPYTDAGTTVGATYDYDETLCGGATGAGDVVYSITPANSGFMYVSTCDPLSPPSVDTKIWVVESVSLTEIACNDDDANCDTYASTLTTEVTAGLTYYIVVGAYGAGSESAFQINVDVIVPGTQCAVPFPITFPMADSLVGATYPVDLVLSPCPSGTLYDAYGYASQAFFYEFTAPVNGLYTFTWCDDGAVSPLTRYTAIANPACGLGFYDFVRSAETAACADDGPYVIEMVMVGGTTKLVEVMSRVCESTPLKGTLAVAWSPLPLTNDDCADAIDLGVGPTGDIFGHNLGATLDGPGIDMCSPADPSEVCADVWYVWEADATGFARFDMCASDNDNKLFVYAGDECLSANPRETVRGGCSDDGCGVSGGGGFGEVACVAGDRFLVRIAGWYIEGDDTYGDCQASGMGTFFINCEVFPTSIRPANDDCVSLVPDVLASAVTLQVPNQTNEWGGWDCLPTLNNIVFEQNVWHAVTLPFCADTLEVNFCGSPQTASGGYGGVYNMAPIFTGCPCSGAYVIIYANAKAYQNNRCVRDGLPATTNGQRVWLWRQLIPGDYYYAVSSSNSGHSDNYFFDYQINFRATEGPCVYCNATANVNSCPPVAGATWIDRVSISNLVNPVAPTTSGCHAYENFTALTPAKVYRGFPYTLTVRYGRTGGGALGTGDSCDVWVDWNQNSGFAANQSEVGERTRLVRVGPDVVCTVNIPLDAYGIGEGPSGMTYMRVRMANAADGGNAPCGTKTWGEVEDYLLNVVDLECGDFDIDGDVDATDISFLRAFYFGSGPAPDFAQRGDIDGDGSITIADIIALADAAYRGGVLNCM